MNVFVRACVCNNDTCRIQVNFISFANTNITGNKEIDYVRCCTVCVYVCVYVIEMELSHSRTHTSQIHTHIQSSV